jgi:DNA primase
MKNQFVGFETLKRAVSMARVLDRYGLLDRLHRSGASLSGVCPIHAGHNHGQFRVSLSKNCWICFGDCHAGGSIIDFVSRKEGIGIRDAALLIQEWFGVGTSNSGRQSVSMPDRNNGHVVPVATRNPPLKLTLGQMDDNHEYLHARGLSKETIATFGVGFCPRGVLAGRIVIPIHNAVGSLVAYAGRWAGIPAENKPKYMLPRGFRKSLELFNLHRAKEIDPSQPLVVVEGFFGCMSVWQAGHRRVVSLMGSMLSAAQEERIAQLTGEDGLVLLLFDEDGAGRKGRREAQERLGKRVVVGTIRLNEGQQPDSLPPEEIMKLILRYSQREAAA